MGASSKLRAGDFDRAQQVFPTVCAQQADGQLTAREDDRLVQSFNMKLSAEAV